MITSKYTKEEIDYVIDKLDLGFMRNLIHSSETDTQSIMDTFAGSVALTRYRLKELFKKIIQ